MKFSLTAVVAGLAATALATPTYDHGNYNNGKCLRDKDVKELLGAYGRLVGSYNRKDSDRYLTEDFVDHSQSINSLLDPANPSNDATFKTKAMFDTVFTNNPRPPFEITVVREPIVECDRFAFVWETQFGKGRKVRGLSALETSREKGQWKIKRMDVEFNALNWAYNEGASYCINKISVGDDASCPVEQ